MKITHFDLEMLKSAGIRAGDILYFEFSGDTGNDECQDLLQKLQSVVGWDGLLAVPTCTSREGAPKPVFNPVSTPSEMGPFSEYFRQQAGVFRSNHPTHSIAVWGKGAEDFTRGHKYAYGRQSPWGESALGYGSPWEKLVRSDAWGMLIDPDWSISPLLHYAAACYTEKYQNITKHSVFPAFSPTWLEANFSQRTGAWEGIIGGKLVRLFRVRKMAAGLLDALEQEAQACTADPAFWDWLETRRWVEQNGYLLAGTAKTILTPTVPFRRWEGKPMTGVFRDLYARVLFLQSGQKRFALVLCDLIGITADLTCAIRERLSEAMPDHPPVIMVACTHAHSTPDTIGAGYAEPAMLDQLVDRIAEGILAASRDLQPVRMGWSKLPIRGIAHSRRWKMKNGEVFTTRYGVPSTWRVDPSIIERQGEIDPELTVIRLEDLSGKVFAVVSNFGVHPSVALASSLASGDINGEAMHILENALEGGAVAFCTTGAAADVDPTLEMPYWGPRNEQSVIHIGRLLAAQILEALERTSVQDKHSMDCLSLFERVKLRQDWLQLMRVERDKMKSEFPEAGETSRWIAGAIENGWCEMEIQAVRMGDLIWAAFPGEVFARTSMRLKQASELPLMILETTNDYIGYLPPQEEFVEGGYECSQHFSSRVYPQAEETARRMVMEAISRLKEQGISPLKWEPGFCAEPQHC